MNAPVYNFLRYYGNSGILRGHMPGHKGMPPFERMTDELGSVYKYDITEISGADSLFEAEGIILESESNAARLYGSGAAVFSAGGSTNCIQAMLGAMKLEKRRIIAVRNVHRAFLNACALLDLEVEWIMPDYTSGILSGTLDICAVEAVLAETPNACLYVTSPDYTGRLADISALSEICRRYGAILLVDNAHGAHLHFFPKSLHPIALGADMCCDSAHKMLPALTGAAVLHMADEKYRPVIKQTMSMFASTSPSYLVMTSLDLCNVYIEERIRRDIDVDLRYIHDLRLSLSDRLVFAEGEPFHITVKAAESGYNGNELAELLRKNGVECEYSDSDTLILLMSPVSRAEDFSKLGEKLKNVLDSAERKVRRPVNIHPILPKRAMSIRDAAFAPFEEIPVENSEGRICASVKVPCPPAVPIAASGEIIDENCINIFKSYGISRVNVVK